MNASSLAFPSAGQLSERVDKLENEEKLEAQNARGLDGDALSLATAFSEFISASSKLENAYRQLQQEVFELGLELKDRNAELNTSLAENKRMRLALQQIVDSMPCGVLVLDREGEITMINPESARLLGINHLLILEDSHTTLRQISQISGINLSSPFEGALNSDVEQECCVRDASGMRWLEVRKRSLFHQALRSEKPDQTILILRDVTAQKRAEQERETGRKAMALAEITTILAHEIRNPLASLELFAELIEEDASGRREWISNLRAGIRSISGIVNNVLSFHGSGSLNLTPVSLSEAIEKAIHFVKPLAVQAEVSLELSTPIEVIFVKGNESAIRQLVLNLVSNAIRHTPAGGNVKVSIYPIQNRCDEFGIVSAIDEAIVEFTDSGCGIREDQIDHIFEPGFSGSGDSSGLGLAVCDRIMKEHGGAVSVSNVKNSGACFALHFPVTQSELITA